MKTTILLLAVLFYSACVNENRTLTDSEKDKIKEEAKVLIKTIIQTCENPDPDKLKSTYLNSPDFVSMVGGVYADYEESLKGMYGYLTNVTRQKATIISEKYTVLDKTTVLYSANSKWESITKNDSTIITDPCGLQFILKKIDNQWKVLSWTEGR